MATSALNRKECYFCKSQMHLECHHIFPGKNRQNSENYGLKVWLCHMHHNEPRYGVHYNKGMMLYLKKMAQAKFEEDHTREEFISVFGRNYL